MLDEILAEIRNYFAVKVHSGDFEVIGGKLSPLDFLQNGQYFRIVGSVLNDGVYQYPASNLTDEAFYGAVWAMSVPPSFVALCTEIKDFVESDAGKVSPYTSESFGGYSYTKATDASGRPVTWQSVFAKRLNKYRRISVL